ncbi:glycoside hydrolase [Longitalea arenae]|uniref:glycoside hydrolase n=1 Tax=Longitalea arenae TaxID=2812558 RepID=UPI00196719E3|nr:glycoside hydrolase [Longitalea arenae]
MPCNSKKRMPALWLIVFTLAGSPAIGQSLGKTKITVRLNDVQQTIHSFGASDCWTTKYVGNWSNVSKKDQIADWLFSMDTLPDGSPKGIGLSLWRFNIGAGSYEQGAASDIPDEWRREECFLQPDGSYNWKKQQGAQWFLQAAKQRGVRYTLGFSIAPPVFMARNGKAYNGTAEPAMNILPGKMNAYAGFMAAVSDHFQFDYLSPVNEPQWNWGKDRISQEGTQATNEEIADLVKLLADSLSARRAKTQVVIGEAGQLDFLYGNNKDNRGDQIYQFFSPASANYIGNLPNTAHIISAHSYFTTCPDSQLVKVRRLVAAKIEEVDAKLESWQTEFGILGNICKLYNGGPKNTGIDYGFYVAKVLHHDLAIANVSSWQWWLAVNPYDYSDGLVYVNDPSGGMNVSKSKEDGIVLDSKQLWCFGNYARFIRPGMKRVNLGIEGLNDPLKAAATLMVSAYKDESSRKLVLVFVNPSSDQHAVQLTGIKRGLRLSNNVMNAYTTDAARNLKKSVVPVNKLVIPPRSVVTCTGSYQ